MATNNSINTPKPFTVPDGGTGLTSATAYAVLCGGTTSTGAVQSIASVGTSGQVLTSNGAGALPTFQAAAGGGLSTVVLQVFTATGTYTPTASMDYCIVEGVGGGGSAGSAQGVAGQGGTGGGGGGAGYFRKLFTATEIGADAAITIGAAGTTAAAGNNPGNAGGNTTFNPAGTGGTLTGNGGAGGTAGTASAAANFNTLSGGGTATGGDLNITGEDDRKGFSAAAGAYGMGGTGGGSMFGFGGPGASAVSGGQNNGYPGIGYGAGGGGAISENGADATGGAATAGYIIVTEYIA
jgi:hypothetical protein